MLRRSKRLTTSLLEEVMSRGKAIHNPLFIARLLKKEGPSRIAVVIPKKIAKTAVERNELRRRTYSVIEILYSDLQSNLHLMLTAKQNLKNSSFTEIVEVLKDFFVKLGLLK